VEVMHLNGKVYLDEVDVATVLGRVLSMLNDGSCGQIDPAFFDSEQNELDELTAMFVSLIDKLEVEFKTENFMKLDLLVKKCESEKFDDISAYRWKTGAFGIKIKMDGDQFVAYLYNQCMDWCIDEYSKILRRNPES
jgi:hypothetical protein